jgi:hypothetical protein
MMSAGKPEVGDVFAHPKTGSRRVVLSEITQYRWWCLLDSGGCVINYSYQFDNWDYIGKSIENVNNIFQTEQDVTNNVAKSDLQHLEAKNDKIKLLKLALKYSNSTAQLALILIRSIDSLNKSAIAKDLEEMITKIKIVLNDESEK